MDSSKKLDGGDSGQKKRSKKGRKGKQDQSAKSVTVDEATAISYLPHDLLEDIGGGDHKVDQEERFKVELGDIAKGAERDVAEGGWQFPYVLLGNQVQRVDSNEVIAKRLKLETDKDALHLVQEEEHPEKHPEISEGEEGAVYVYGEKPEGAVDDVQEGETTDLTGKEQVKPNEFVIVGTSVEYMLREHGSTIHPISEPVVGNGEPRDLNVEEMGPKELASMKLPQVVSAPAEADVVMSQDQDKKADELAEMERDGFEFVWGGIVKCDYKGDTNEGAGEGAKDGEPELAICIENTQVPLADGHVEVDDVHEEANGIDGKQPDGTYNDTKVKETSQVVKRKREKEAKIFWPWPGSQRKTASPSTDNPRVKKTTEDLGVVKPKLLSVSRPAPIGKDDILCVEKTTENGAVVKPDEVSSVSEPVPIGEGDVLCVVKTTEDDAVVKPAEVSSVSEPVPIGEGDVLCVEKTTEDDAVVKPAEISSVSEPVPIGEGDVLCVEKTTEDDAVVKPTEVSSVSEPVPIGEGDVLCVVKTTEDDAVVKPAEVSSVSEPVPIGEGDVVPGKDGEYETEKTQDVNTPVVQESSISPKAEAPKDKVRVAPKQWPPPLEEQEEVVYLEPTPEQVASSMGYKYSIPNEELPADYGFSSVKPPHRNFSQVSEDVHPLQVMYALEKTFSKMHRNQLNYTSMEDLLLNFSYYPELDANMQKFLLFEARRLLRYTNWSLAQRLFSDDAGRHGAKHVPSVNPHELANGRGSRMVQLQQYQQKLSTSHRQNPHGSPPNHQQHPQISPPNHQQQPRFLPRVMPPQSRPSILDPMAYAHMRQNHPFSQFSSPPPMIVNPALCGEQGPIYPLMSQVMGPPSVYENYAATDSADQFLQPDQE